MSKLSPALLLVLASCVVVRPPAQPHPGREIALAVEGMYADLSDRKWDVLEGHFLPEAELVFATPTGPKRMSPSAFIEHVRKDLDDKDILEERMVQAWVQTHGSMAVVWSKFEGRRGKPDEVKVWTGVDAFTLVKVDGRWRISQLANSIDQSPEKP